MLTKPVSGWTDFNLIGTATYELSYLDDIAFNWIEQAIHGLETMLPFCVKGFLEPYRMICVVSFWNCHIIVEDDEKHPLKKTEIINEYSHTSMIEFCRYLYEDVSLELDSWVSFADYLDEDLLAKKRLLTQKLEELNELIINREEHFDDKHCFL